MSTDRNQLQLPSPASVARERVHLVAENVARHPLKEVANGGRAAPYDTASTLHHDLTDRSGGDPSESPDDEEFKKLCSLVDEDEDEDEDESQDGGLSLETQLLSTSQDADYATLPSQFPPIDPLDHWEKLYSELATSISDSLSTLGFSFYSLYYENGSDKGAGAEGNLQATLTCVCEKDDKSSDACVDNLKAAVEHNSFK